MPRIRLKSLSPGPGSWGQHCVWNSTLGIYVVEGPTFWQSEVHASDLQTTTSRSDVIVPDMSISLPTAGLYFMSFFARAKISTGSGDNVQFKTYVNGTYVSAQWHTYSRNTYGFTCSAWCASMNTTVAMYWVVGAVGITASITDRWLRVIANINPDDE